MPLPSDPAVTAELQLEKAGHDIIRVRGELGFATALDGRSGFAALLNVEGETVVDLAAVTRADSAGVALLVEWQRQALARGYSLKFINVPAQILAISRVSGVDTLLLLG